MGRHNAQSGKQKNEKSAHRGPQLIGPLMAQIPGAGEATLARRLCTVGLLSRPIERFNLE
jgi:hypothetical protein